MQIFKRFLIIISLLTTIVANLSAQVPSVQLKDLNGKPVDSATLSNDGNPFIICFWATWCKPCVRELNAINENYPDWIDETGVKIYAISIDEAQNSTRVKPVSDAHGWDYEILLDQNGNFARAMGCQNPPHTIIFDGTGKVIESHSGYTDGSENHLIEQVRKIIANK